MQNIIRQISVVITVLATVVVNGLANALPINGLNTGEISDRFTVYFVPAGYVFSIWGLIYLGLIAFAIFQALPAQRENPRMRATGWWVVLSGLANITWILLWHYEIFPLTILAMLILLASLIVVYLRLGIGRVKASKAEIWLVRVPFSIYLGWITVATVANVTSVLDYLQWNAFSLAPEIWMVIILAVVLVISTLMSITRRDLAYTLVILWALAGIGIKHAATAAVATPTWITFGLVALALVLANIYKPNTKRS
jgi:hypothetical protein